MNTEIEKPKEEHWLFGKTLKIATEETCKAPWSGGKNGKYFRCCFCGYRFKPGDKWRGVYTNDMPDCGGNPLVCESCANKVENDTNRLRDMWKRKCDMWRNIKERFWSFLKNYNE